MTDSERMAPPCSEEVCVTCSDVAVPATIVALLEDDMAIVGTSAGEEQISVALVSAGLGDTVLVHAGEAIAVVPQMNIVPEAGRRWGK